MTSRLDIRWPIGVLWIVLGALLAGYGLGAARSGGASLTVDRWWGATMVGFGVTMLVGARRHDVRSRRASRERRDPGQRAEHATEGHDARHDGE